MSESPLFEFVFPFDPVRLSHNARLSWRARHRLTREVRVMVWGVWVAAGRPIAPHPLRLEIEVQRGRGVDPGNIEDGTKALLDGLCNTRAVRIGVRLIAGSIGFLPDDSARWVSIPYRAHLVVHRNLVGQEKVIFRFYDRRVAVRPVAQVREGA